MICHKLRESEGYSSACLWNSPYWQESRFWPQQLSRVLHIESALPRKQPINLRRVSQYMYKHALYVTIQIMELWQDLVNSMLGTLDNDGCGGTPRSWICARFVTKDETNCFSTCDVFSLEIARFKIELNEFNTNLTNFKRVRLLNLVCFEAQSWSYYK